MYAHTDSHARTGSSGRSRPSSTLLNAVEVHFLTVMEMCERETQTVERPASSYPEKSVQNDCELPTTDITTNTITTMIQIDAHTYAFRLSNVLGHCRRATPPRQSTTATPDTCRNLHATMCVQHSANDTLSGWVGKLCQRSGIIICKHARRLRHRLPLAYSPPTPTVVFFGKISVRAQLTRRPRELAGDGGGGGMVLGCEKG